MSEDHDLETETSNGERDERGCEHPFEERVYSSDRASCRKCGETLQTFTRRQGVSPKEHEASIECHRHLESLNENMRALFRKWLDETRDRDAVDARAEAELRPIGDALDALVRDESTLPSEKLPTLKRYAATVERLLRP